MGKIVRVENRKTTEAIITMQRNLFAFLSVLFFVTTLATTSIALRNRTLTFFKAPELELNLAEAKSQGEFLAHLILNRFQASIENIQEQLQPWVAPSYYFELSKHMRKQSQEMLNHGTDFEWYLSESTIEQLDPKHVRIYLKGTVAEYLPLQDEKKQLVQEEPCTFSMDMEQRHGKLLLNNFKKEKGSS